VQHALALVRGPFLEGFWLREETGFDEWVQQQWQVRLHLLFERLSSWQETGGELEPARVTLTRWLALDRLSEEAYRRLMRVDLALGDASAALQVYATCRARLAEELRVKPSADTVALAEHIRASAASLGTSPARRATATAGSQPPGELVAPLVGRAAAFSQLVGGFQQARQGQPRAVLVVGEAGIGKTRLATEFVAWARAQGAEVLSGQAFEMGGRLPYQPLVEAIRPRLEAENAPEDLLDDLWLAELARILRELRVCYPDLPAPTEDELAARGRLFEAVARLLDALAQRAPLVLLLDDLHWVDGASLDLLRYLARYWKSHGTRVLLLGTVRSEGLEPKSQLSAQLADLGRDLPLTQVPLQMLSQAETLQLIQAIVVEGTQGTSGGGEQRQHSPARPSTAAALPVQEQETPLVALSDVLFAQTGAAVVPVGDAQAVAGTGVAGAPARSGWHLEAGADPGHGRGPHPGPAPARAVTALGARADPGAPGEAHPASAPAGDGQRCAGDPGERAASVAPGRGRSAGRRRGAGGGRRQWHLARGGGRSRPTGHLSLRP
jgi:hypothetical protein